jgi:LPPG:FO 2-phospho-L-lactate transferase
MTDAPVETWVQLEEADNSRAWVHFQEYFVHRRTDVVIRDVRVNGIDQALPAPGVIEAIETADLIVFCPSNPFVSIGPILQVQRVREAILAARSRGTLVAGISPLIGGATVKGPAARMLSQLGYEPSAAGVAAVYRDIMDVWLIDTLDRGLTGQIASYGMRTIVADALMRGRRGEARLARELLRRVLRGHPAGGRLA